MILRLIGQEIWCQSSFLRKSIHSSAVCLKVQSGRYKVTPKQDRPLTYEMAQGPHQIAHRKAWNSWNTSNLIDGQYQYGPEITTDDMFIRKFIYGTWHGIFVSEVIIKRRFNLIIIAGVIHQAVLPRKLYFLIGYTEELLSYWFRCPIKMELQSVAEKKDIIFKYI